MLQGLQCGRAVAALLVVIFHANSFLLPKRLYDGTHAGWIFNFGYAGVEFFFVLSGFIMLLVHRKDFGKPQQAPHFLCKRIIRIYPFYWVVLIGLVLLYAAAPGSGPAHALDPQAIAVSALLFPTGQPLVLGVAWTLQHEVLFYAIFMLLLLHLRAGLTAYCIWQLMCLAALPGLPLNGLAQTNSFLLSPYNLLFSLGACSALLYGRLTRWAVPASLIAGTALFTVTGVLDVMGPVAMDHALRTLMFGLGAALAVAGLAAAPWRFPRWLSFLEDTSYAIYLVHGPALSVFGVFIRKAGLNTVLPPLAMLVLVCVAAVGAGCLAHLVLERPLLSYLSRSRRKPGQLAPRQPTLQPVRKGAGN